MQPQPVSDNARESGCHPWNAQNGFQSLQREDFQERKEMTQHNLLDQKDRIIALPFKEPEIESGIPIPEKSWKIGKWKRLILKLKPGDSFLVPNASQRAVIISHYRIGLGMIELTSRRLETGAYRIWRIK
jgi:hypothetical protein